MEMSVTSLKNWEKYVETGDNSVLGDVDITSAPKGTEAVLSAEGLERRILIGPEIYRHYYLDMTIRIDSKGS
jgi:hypothetical protein